MIVNPSSMAPWCKAKKQKYFGHIALAFDSEIHRTKPSKKYLFLGICFFTPAWVDNSNWSLVDPAKHATTTSTA